MYHQFKELGDVDITKDPMEVGPTAHYTMGGIRVDPETQQTRIKGLFAAGECAAGMHGANRLGGNSLSDLLVFGRIAGAYASKYVKDAPATKPPQDQLDAAKKEALAYFDREEGENPFLLHEKLKEDMSAHVGIIRTEDDLQKGLEAIQALKARVAKIKVDGNRHFNAAWHEAFDMRNMMVISEAMCRGAIMRKESRGAHARDDYPKMDNDHFSKFNIASHLKGDEMVTEEVEHPDPPKEIKEILEEKE